MFTLAAFQENDGVQSFQMKSYGNPVILADSSPQQIVGFSVPKGELHALSWKLDPLQSFSFPTKTGFHFLFYFFFYFKFFQTSQTSKIEEEQQKI